jgi:hypothetical protein
MHRLNRFNRLISFAKPLLFTTSAIGLGALRPSLSFCDASASTTTSSSSSSTTENSGNSNAKTALATAEGVRVDEEDEDYENDRDNRGGASSSSSSSRLINPGDFSNLEDDKTLPASSCDGLAVTLQCSVGPPSRDGASVGAHIGISSQGSQAVWVLTDQKLPSLQAVLQPGQEGKNLRLNSTFKLFGDRIPGLSTEGELVLAASGVQGAKGTAKMNGDDYFAQLMLQPFGAGGQPPIFELGYHQTVVNGFTLGGSLQGVVDISSPIGVQNALYQSFGSWRTQRGDSMVLWRLGQQPKGYGEILQELKTSVWHKPTRWIELGSTFIVSAPVSLFSGMPPEDSAASVACRMTFDGHPGGMSPTLTANLSSSLVAGLSYVTPSATNWSNTFLRTTYAATLDHSKRDFKMGVQVEVYY